MFKFALFMDGALIQKISKDQFFKISKIPFVSTGRQGSFTNYICTFSRCLTTHGKTVCNSASVNIFTMTQFHKINRETGKNCLKHVNSLLLNFTKLIGRQEQLFQQNTINITLEQSSQLLVLLVIVKQGLYYSNKTLYLYRLSDISSNIALLPIITLYTTHVVKHNTREGNVKV